jgi:hypothetical protein
MTMNTSGHSRRGRIPLALQAVFLASNGGEEVDVPPKNLGFKVFSRMLGNKTKNQMYKNTDKKVEMSAPSKTEVCQICPFSNSIFQCFSKLTRSFHFAALKCTCISPGILRYRSEIARILDQAVHNHQ